MFHKILKTLLSLYRWIRSICLNLVFIVILLVFLSILLSSDSFEVPEGAALLIAPTGILVEERTRLDSLSDLLGGNPARDEVLLEDLLDAISFAAEDEKINAIVLVLDALQSADLSKLQDIALALTEFKSSDKPIYAIADNLSQSQYYLASHADEILLNPLGMVALEGMSSYQYYFVEAIEKLGINVHIFRVGEYKSAVEPFEQRGMSDAARENYQQLLGQQWQLYLDGIAQQRQLEPQQINDLINNQDQYLAEQNGDSAALALDFGLVDQLSSRPAMQDYLISRIGLDADNNSFLQVSYQRYLSARRIPLTPIPASDQVGIIMASGTILDGEAESGSIGGDSLATLISQASNDENIKALVLRIDSPGGSAFASEVIRQQLLDFKQSGKPLIVSMGSVAASGGYWIASAADEIWATDATITGSIGIFGVFPTFSESLANLGIYIDGVSTTQQAGALGFGRDLPEVTQNSLQLIVENGYQRFLTIVADARSMSPQEVDTLGQGRVWSGTDALAFNLIDNIGNLDDAIKAAAELAGLNQYQIRRIYKAPSASELFMENLREIFNISSWFAVRQPTLANLLMSNMPEKLEASLEHFLINNDPGNLYLQCIFCQPKL
jgi:protease-4